MVNVETYESEGKAREVLKTLVYIIWTNHADYNRNAVIIDLNGIEIKGEGEKDGESK